MKLKFLIFAVSLFIFQACGSGGGSEEQSAEDSTATEAMEEAVVEEEVADNSLTDEEKEQGWILLFDGESPEGWRGYMKETFPSSWTVDENALHIPGTGTGEAGAENGGDILYDQKFGNFHLSLEWKLGKGGNSGIFYLGQEDERFSQLYFTAPEMQVLDNVNHPDAILGKDGNRQAGSLYDLYPADPQNANPHGEWNKAEIIVYNGTVVHKQNGETVVEYHLWTDKWNEDVANSKFPDLNPEWADVAKEGYIGLQDHGEDVWFKNIKIREL